MQNLSERLVVEESLQHSQSVGGLIHRDHVTSFEDAQESQALSGLGGTSLFALDIPSVLGGLVVRVLHG
jgi:hypothetical protein